MTNNLIILIVSLFSITLLAALYKKGLFKNVFSWVSDGISIDETRVSLFMVAFAVSFSVSMYLVLKNGVIPDSLIQLIGYLIAAIWGVNAIKIIPSVRQKITNTLNNEYDYSEK